MNRPNLKIKEWAEEDRPREKLLTKGIQSLSDCELLSIIIGSGTKGLSVVELSREILNQVDNNLNELGKYTVKQLTSGFKGIGQARALNILAALELGKRRMSERPPKKEIIRCSRDAYRILQSFLCDLHVEEFWILLLNRGNKVIDKIKISRGGVSETTADSKLVFKEAITNLASGIIISHNHPSGDTTPSKSDDTVTKRIKESGTLLGIPLLDHIIVGEGSYYSYADEGRL